MATTAQIAANQKNAQLSTGPTTEAGKQKISLNAVRHGFSGATIQITPEEKDAYELFCLDLKERFSPKSEEESELVQNYADLRWTLQQIAGQELTLRSIVNSIGAPLVAAGNFEQYLAATEPYEKRIRNLSIYESRKRRAAEALFARLTEILAARKQELAEAVKVAKLLKAQNQPFTASEFGFVCSQTEIDRQLQRESALAAAAKRP